MQSIVKTNRLALISFISGLIAIVSIGIYIVVFNWVSSLSGPEAVNSVGYLAMADILVPVRNLSAGVALITGILALREIKKKSGAEKGKVFAWIGIVLGVGWILFALMVGVIFSLGELLYEAGGS